MASGLDLSTLISLSSLVYFVIGLLIGVILKRAFILALAIIAFLALLVVLGFVSFGLNPTSLVTLYGLFNLARPVAGQAATQATDLVKLLPITSVAFLLGVFIGLWKG
jgi:hypothetical protein